MRSLYIPILCFVFLRFGAQSLPGDSEDLWGSIDKENIFPELSHYEYDDVQGNAKTGSSGTTDQITTDQSTTDQSTTDQSTTDQSTTDSSTTDQSTTDSSTTDQSTTDQSTTDAPTTPTPCSDAGKFVCKDCLSVAYVDNNCEKEVYINCEKGTACVISSEETYGYCTTHTETECSCGSSPQQCDFYASNNVLYCSSTNGPFLSEPCGTNKTCSGGECVPYDSSITTTTTPAPATPPGDFSCGSNYTGWVLESPTCQNAIYCKNGIEINSESCNSGEYFDPSGGCTTAPPEKCGDNCEGFCPDKIECGKFYICDGNGNVIDHQDCPAGKYFNPNSSPPKCESDSSICPATIACIAYTESPDSTTEPITASVTTINPSESTTIYYPTDVACNADTVGTYEYPPDCTMYYRCQESSPGVFEITVGQCWGDLAYNPLIGGCDYPENVPGCSVKTR